MLPRRHGPGARGFLLLALASALCCVRPPCAGAGEDIFWLPLERVEEGTPGLGFALRGDSGIYQAESDSLDLMPLYFYEGSRLFAHGTSVGAHIFRKRSFELDLLARYRFDRLYQVDSADLTDMRRRRPSLDGGLSARVNTRIGTFQLEWVSDMLDRHNGTELDLGYRYTWEIGDWVISPFVTYRWQDKELVNYYYGVSQAQASPDRPVYAAEGAENIRWGANVAWWLSHRSLLFGSLAAETLDDEIANSPIVSDERSVKGFLGYSFLFGNGSGKGRPRPDDPSWSWRLGAGYMTDCTFFTSTIGCAEPVKPHATLAYADIGKLLKRGPRMDFYGRFGFVRHFMGNVIDDYNEYTGYMKMVVKAFSTWSDRPAFRFGFGLGLSYSESISPEELKSQFVRSRGTSWGEAELVSHLMNYLEASIDFPLRRHSGKGLLANCYLGVGVLHRSAIFGLSELFNEIKAGVNATTLYLECER